MWELVSNDCPIPVDARLSSLSSAAALAVDGKCSVVEAARSISVPESTMRRWVTALTSRAGLHTHAGAPTLLTTTEERSLVALLLTRQALNAPMTKRSAGLVAGAILRRRQRKFGTESGLPSKEWWESFLKRWPQLASRKPSRLSSEALLRPTRQNLLPWFELVQATLAIQPDLSCWVNFDESQIRPGSADEPVLAARGSKHVHAPKSGYSKHVTIAPCVSATGAVLPTLFIFQGKTVTKEILAGANPNDAVAVTGLCLPACR